MPERPRFWLRWWLEVAAALLLLVPLLVLLAAGVVWLWQAGWLHWWLLAAAAIAGLAWLVLRIKHGRQPRRAVTSEEPTLTEPDRNWAPHELAAWEAVRQLSSEADGSMLGDRTRVLAAAEATLDAVASHYHPDQSEPVLHFTAPELLLLVERASARLRLALLEQVPLSDRLRVGQLMRAWGYRPLVAAGLRHGRTAYGLFRVVRAISPLNALFAEVRDSFIDDLVQRLGTNVGRRIARLWIEEVGRAAIELYSGRLRLDAVEHARAAESEGLGTVASPAATPGALRILIAGQTKAGKSTLVNGLLGDTSAGVDVLPLTTAYEGYELRQEGVPPAYLIDSPGIDDADGIAETTARAFASDLIIWVAAAHRADRALDRQALDALRARFDADPRRRMPPLIVVASHIDRLSPVREWSPPYDVDTPDGSKARSIRDAIEAIADDLEVPLDTIVPARLDSDPPYNLELVWLRLESAAPEAERARWVRILRGAVGRERWQTLWRQLAGSGRIIGRLARG